MNSMPYGGYSIRPAPLQLANTGEWSVDLFISIDRGSSVTEKKYSTGDTFKTKEEAVEHCIKLGKQIIDGEAENCTVEDL